ncbi:class I SAM-dependent methyltransferase [Tumidithrix helvetica]|uniref:class I SAM-dependent methyltransferase n=1 Tax=Tumidithrix helvetica TaxID=3457545 RepID=UPI003CC566DE
MTNLESDSAWDAYDRVRDQYDQAPYPDFPIAYSPRQAINTLFPYDLTTAYYLRDRIVISPKGKLILDVGCGSGVTTHYLAEANPHAKIVGIDISPVSIRIAEKRLQHHGFQNVEFYAIPIENVPDLGKKFDYINCDETLYLLPDPQAGLKVMQSVLAEHGVIRANLHSVFQRANHYRSQELFKFLGLTEECSQETSVATIREILESLDDSTVIKRVTWLESVKTDEAILMNFLLEGDRGFTVPEMFELIRNANLEFLGMVNERFWHIPNLFQDSQKIPEYLDLALSIATDEQRLHLYELMHPVNRLLDFWCGHVGVPKTYLPPVEWEDSMWHHAKAHLHPQLKTDRLRADLEQAIAYETPFNISAHIKVTTPDAITLFTPSAICLKLLWDRPQTMPELIQTWLKIKPLNLLTMQPVTTTEAFEQLKQILTDLESLMFVMLETCRDEAFGHQSP